MRTIVFIIIILSSISCNEESKIKTYKPEFESSEYPIWVSNQCTAKEITLWVNHFADSNLVLKLDNKVLDYRVYNKRSQFNRYYLSVKLNPSNIVGPLILKNKLMDTVMFEIPIIKRKVGDTINFSKVALGFDKSYVCYGRKWWPDYFKGYFSKNTKILLEYKRDSYDKIVGDSILRIVKVWDVKYTDTITNNSIYLKDLIYEDKIKFYKWFPMVESRYKKSKLSFWQRLKIGDDIFNNKNIETYCTIENEKRKPSYYVFGTEYGEDITGVITSCNTIDTLNIEPIKLPDIFHPGLAKIDKIKN